MVSVAKGREPWATDAAAEGMEDDDTLMEKGGK
jgi:hypothetical protein